MLPYGPNVPPACIISRVYLGKSGGAGRLSSGTSILVAEESRRRSIKRSPQSAKTFMADILLYRADGVYWRD